MTKTQALKKIESTLKKSLKSLTKDLNDVLKEAGVWYCADDFILDHEEFRKPTDRNADQLVIDYATHILNGGEMYVEDEKKPWTKDELKRLA